MIKIEKNTGEQVPFFDLDGKTYYVPAKIPAHVFLKSIERYEHMDENEAGYDLFKTIAGEEAFEAVMNSDDVTLEIFQQLMLWLERHVMGNVEGAGNGPNS